MNAGVWSARLRMMSPSETKPTGIPSPSTTGAPEMPRSTNKRSASATEVSGESVNTSVFIIERSTDSSVTLDTAGIADLAGSFSILRIASASARPTSATTATAAPAQRKPVDEALNASAPPAICAPVTLA